MSMRREGRLMMYCDTCNVNFVMARQKFDGTCPRCGEFLRRFRCSRCGHMWTPRDWRRLPDVCPRCKSPYWNRERVKNGDYDSRGIAGVEE